MCGIMEKFGSVGWNLPYVGGDLVGLTLISSHSEHDKGNIKVNLGIAPV